MQKSSFFLFSLNISSSGLNNFLCAVLRGHVNKTMVTNPQKFNGSDRSYHNHRAVKTLIGFKTNQNIRLLVVWYTAASLLWGESCFIALANAIFPSGVVRARFSLWSCAQRGSSVFDRAVRCALCGGSGGTSRGWACGSWGPGLFDWFSPDSTFPITAAFSLRQRGRDVRWSCSRKIWDSLRMRRIYMDFNGSCRRSESRFQRARQNKTRGNWKKWCGRFWLGCFLR